MCRPAFSDADNLARAQLAAWGRERGYSIFLDPMGNLFLRRPGREEGPAVLTGSHLDTPPIGGGWFDGAFGVLAGLEVMEALDEAEIETTLPIDLVVWANEEGTRFEPGCMGSMCFAGKHKPSDFAAVTDAAGLTVEAELQRMFDALPSIELRAFGAAPAAYVEAHVEQGPALARAGKSIGAVTGIQGVRWLEVEITGTGGHAGATPMLGRRDALADAVSIIAALKAAMVDPLDALRFTVGRLEVSPGACNTIPDRVLFTIDLRYPEATVLQRLADQVAAICRAEARSCTVEVRECLRTEVCRFDSWIVTLIDEVAAELRLPAMRLPSGAFHDAVYLADITPTGMIFVRCAAEGRGATRCTEPEIWLPVAVCSPGCCSRSPGRRPPTLRP